MVCFFFFLKKRFKRKSLRESKLTDLDWRGNMDMSKRIVDTRLTKDVSGPIVLAHDMKHTIEILAAHIISTAKAHGLKMVTVGECLGDDPSNWYRTAPRL